MPESTSFRLLLRTFPGTLGANGLSLARRMGPVEFGHGDACTPLGTPGRAGGWGTTAIVALLLLCPLLAGGQPQPQVPEDLTEASLEQLIRIRVTSVAKKRQDISKAAAAVYVITQEDIRRSGVTSIPEALRMAPGLQVAQIDANKWAISSRGFNGRFANKLLVLIDGRTVYTPLFSGVFWDMQDVLLEDIDRIEVIRGPGATMWGANAVNGVINIITKTAADTQGGVATAGGGNQEGGFGALRWGGRLGSKAHYRLYQRYFSRNALRTQAGSRASDQWDALRGGFRVDWEMNQRDSLTLQGDVFDTGAGQTLSLPTLSAPFTAELAGRIQTSGGNALSRWQRQLSDTSDLSLQVYFDRTARREHFLYREDRNTYDVALEHRFQFSDRNELLWGLEYRGMNDRFESSAHIFGNPARRDNHSVSVFFQDELQLIPGKLYLTLGSKFERDGFRGYPVQPTVRALWNPNPTHSLWGAVSRGVRTPSRTEQDLGTDFATVPGPLGAPTVIRILGTRAFESENVIAYELGYRVQPRRGISLDVATFYNVYDNLRTGEPRTPFIETSPRPTHLVIPIILENQAEGETYGVEVAAQWKPVDWWRVRTSYSWLEIQLRRDASSLDDTIAQWEDVSPAHQANLASLINLPWKLNLDTMLYFVDSIRGGRPFGNTTIPSYTRVDARLGWRPKARVELSIAAQNLLDHRHLEFEPESYSRPLQVGRSFYGKVSWGF